jgi:hypothetical protein
MYSAGGWIRGGALKIVSTDALPNPDTNGVNVDFVVHAAPQTVKSADGKVSHIEGGTNALTIFVRRSHSSWKVMQWTRAK